MKKIVVLLKIIVISVLCSAIMMFLHRITLLETIEATGLSWLANQYGAETAAFLWGVAAYYIVSQVYVIAEKDLKGRNINKALLFGGLIGGTWLLGMIELDQTWNNVIMGLVDAFMVTLVCVLTSLFVVLKHKKVDNSDDKKEKINNNIIEILIVATIFALNRLFFGLFLGKYYNNTFDYIMIPVYSFFMGFMWVKLKDTAGSGKLNKKALKYGVIIWGMPSGIFMYFIAFLFKDMLIGMTMRNILDMIFMSLAVRLAMKYRINHQE